MPNAWNHTSVNSGELKTTQVVAVDDEVFELLELLEPFEPIEVLELLLSLLLLFESLDLLSLLGALSDWAIFFFCPCLKSVSYHPLPLKRNPTTEISFFNCG